MGRSVTRIFVGTEKFVGKIKKCYLPNKPHEEVPHQKQVIKAIDPQLLIIQAAKKLNVDLRRYQKIKQNH